MKAVVAAFNQEKALVGAFSVITNLRMELFEALVPGAARPDGDRGDGDSGGCAHLSGIIIHLFIYKPYNNILIVTTDCNDRLSSELPQLRGVVRAPRHAATHRGHRPTELGWKRRG